METRFKIVYTDEAYKFIHSLPEKVQDKIAYNIFKSRVVIDTEEDMKLYTHEEMLDSVIGEKGTPRRDEYEAKIDAFLIGEAIKQARESKNITQEQLGEMIGVKKAQISRIEKGSNLTIQTIRKVFRAMGMNINLEIVGLGKFAI